MHLFGSTLEIDDLAGRQALDDGSRRRRSELFEQSGKAEKLFVSGELLEPLGVPPRHLAVQANDEEPAEVFNLPARPGPVGIECSSPTATVLEHCVCSSFQQSPQATPEFHGAPSLADLQLQLVSSSPRPVQEVPLESLGTKERAWPAARTFSFGHNLFTAPLREGVTGI